MYYGKKKTIIISIVIVLLVIILAVGGLFLFLATDLFKSNETLFLKYVANQYNQLMSGTTNVQSQDILNAEEQMPYETNATLAFNYEDAEGESLKELEKAKINIITREDKKNEKQYANLKIDYDKQNLIDLHYAKSDNIYALNWEEIVLKRFVGIKNEDLKEFAQKLGVADTQDIPNEIDFDKYSEILEITEQEKQHIIGTYSEVLLNNISEEKYTKQKDMAIVKNGVNYNTTAYRLDLSEQEIRNIEIKILETLKQDSITLNLITTKAKLIDLSEEYTTINGLTQIVEESIQEIMAEEIDNSKGLSIVVYEYEGQAIQTEIILKNEIKLTITSEIENNVKTTNVQIFNLSENEDYGTVNIKLVTTQTENSTVVNVDMNIDNEQTISITASNVGLASTGRVQTTMAVSVVNEDGETITVDYDAETKYGELTEEIVDLDKTNCVILNNYSSRNLKSVLTSIGNRLSYVFEQKMKIIIPETTEEVVPETENTNQDNNI